MSGLRRSLFAAAPLALFAAACATAPAPKPAHYTFFPGYPDPPRVQFLTSFASERDLRGAPSGFSTFITGQTPTDNPIGKPYGVAFSEDKLFICDSAARAVVILDFDKRQMTALPTDDETALAAPINIFIDRDHNRYITDGSRQQVLCLDAASRLKWILGRKDEMRPADVTVGGGRVYVADVKNHEVRVYREADQALLYTIPRPEDRTNMNAILLMPSNLALDAAGRLYASDSAAGRVEIYDRDGRYISTLGEFGDDPQKGLLKRPKGVAVARDGLVYVVDSAYQLVQMFDAQGNYLMCFGYPGSGNPAGMTLPAKVIVDYDHVKLFQKYAAPDFKVEYLVVVTNQFGLRKVAIYGFGHKRT